MTHLPLAFAASYVFIFLKAIQQRSVIHNNRRLVVPTSISMAFTEVYVIATVAKAGYSVPLVLAIGLGAGLGALTAMTVHNIHLKRKHK